MRLLLFLAAFAFGLGTTLPAIAQNIFTSDVLMCSGHPWIDVRCNGALGDGSHDDTNAINTTVALAITNNVPAFFAAGAYKVSSKLTWDYQGIAGNGGLQVISSGATIDGRTIAGGNVLQIQCSGGTVGSPVVCGNLRIDGDFYVLGNTPAYAVVIGKSDFSDRHNATHIAHLVVTNSSANVAAGGIQANYLTDGDLWFSGTTAGGSSTVTGVAFDQVQTSRIGGYGSTAGASGVALLLENGASVGNNFVGFAYDQNTSTCVSITSVSATRNGWIAPYFPCTTTVNANTAANQNLFLGPSFAGTNMGPTSGGVTVVGRGSLSRFSAPTVSSRTLVGADDGTIFSAANATGPSSQFTAASLPVTLPDPAQVGAGWAAGFVTDANKAVVITAPAGKIMLAGQQLSTLTVGAAGSSVGSETAVLQSDGSNFRVTHLSQGAGLLNGAQTALPARWEFVGGPGYQTTQGDNGMMISSGLVSSTLAVTLPQMTQIQPGYMVGVANDNQHPVTLSLNGANGGQFILSDGTATTTPQTYYVNHGLAAFQFDGASFRQILGRPPTSVLDFGADPTGVLDSAPAFQRAYNANIGCVKVPAGTFYINSQVTINAQPPCFEGTPWSENVLTPTAARSGSWLRIDGAGFTPFAISSASTAGAGRFANLAVLQTQPTIGVSWAPTNYPYVWNCTATGGELRFDDIYLYNVSNGISITNNCARTTFGRIRGQPLMSGIFIDGAQDIIHADSSIEFWPYWSSDVNVIMYQQANTDPITCNRCDGPVFNQVFALGYHSAMRLGSSGSGITRAMHVSFLYSDSNKYGLFITGDNTLAFIDSYFGAAQTITGGDLPSSTCVLVQSVAAQIQVGNFNCLISGGPAVSLANTTAGSQFFAASAVISSYNQDNNASPAFLAANTATGSNQIYIATAPSISGTNNGGSVWARSTGIYGLPTYQTDSQTATNGGTSTVQDFSVSSALLLHEAGAIATANIILPNAAATQHVDIYSDKAITALALFPSTSDPAWPVGGQPASLAAFGHFACDFILFGTAPGQWVCH